MIQAQKIEKGFSPARLSRRQREAGRFLRFRQEFVQNGRNAYRAALAVGYSERMARAKSYRLGRLAEAVERLERMGFALLAEPDSYRSSTPGTTSPRDGLQACANEGSTERHLEPSAPAVEGLAPEDVSYQAATEDAKSQNEHLEVPESRIDGGQPVAERRFYGFAQLRKRRWLNISYPAKPIVPDTKP